MDAVNHIITENNGLVYVILVAPGTYVETITLNNLAIANLAIVAQSSTSGSQANDALVVTQIQGNIISTSNNFHIHSLIVRGFDLVGVINLMGDVPNTQFGKFGIIFSAMTLYPNAAVALNLNNVGQVILDDCGTAIVSGSSNVTVQNVAFFAIYNTFFHFGPVSLVTAPSANKPFGFSTTSVQSAFGNFIDDITIDSGTGTLLTLRYTRVLGAIHNGGSLTSVNSVFQNTVTNSGTWNSFGDSVLFSQSNTGVINHETHFYTPTVPSNWPTQPVTVQGALDNLAAARPVIGTATLAAGTVVVASSAVTASSKILLTYSGALTSPGFLTISAKSAGVSFTVTSSSGTDASSFQYAIFN